MNTSSIILLLLPVVMWLTVCLGTGLCNKKKKKKESVNLKKTQLTNRGELYVPNFFNIYFIKVQKGTTMEQTLQTVKINT